MSTFITIEGGEGVGKSTAMNFISAYLTDKGINFILTREPGGTVIAETIRRTLLAKFDEPMDPKTELLLMFASRIQHVNHLIKPALAEGKVVVCDRFMDASYAYQGGGRGLGYECVASLDKWLNMGLKPDATLLLDAPIEVGFSRLEKNREKDRIECEDRTFFESVIDTYRLRVEQDPKRFHVINAAKTIDEVQDEIKHVLDSIL